MNDSPELTHKGWLGLCPIYAADLSAPDPYVVARCDCLEWWLDVNVGFFIAINTLNASFIEDYAGYFPLRITGRIKK